MSSRLTAPALAVLGTLVAMPVAASGSGDPTGGRDFCDGSRTPLCQFLNAPVRLDPEEIVLEGRPYTFHETQEALEFVDAAGRRWRAPPGTLTDGASIPVALSRFVGSPTSGEFVNAAALHDAMCGVGNTGLPDFHARGWEETHRMFYDALRVGGTDAIRAKMMFAAVYLGGPRWEPGDRTFDSRDLWADAARSPTRGLGGTRPAVEGQSRGLEGRALGNVPAEVVEGIMQATAGFIAMNDPTIGEIELYITGQERRALVLHAATVPETAPDDGTAAGRDPDLTPGTRP